MSPELVAVDAARATLPHQPEGAVEDRVRALREVSGALETVYRLCPDLAVLAIRWMHLKHPLHEVQETLLHCRADRDGGPARSEQRIALARSLVGLVWRMVRCVVFGGYLTIQVIRLRWATRQPRRVLARQAFDVIARTCCYEPDAPADGSDFYFGDLQQRLARHGVRMLLLCGDATDGTWLRFAKGQVITSGPCRLPELAVVSPIVPLQMAGQQLLSCLRLLYRSRHLSQPLTRRVSWLAAMDCLSLHTALTGLLCWVSRAAVRTWRPRAFLTLYEGHAWEACLRWGVKAADAFCQTIGYQHTVVFRESLSVTAPYGEGTGWSVPDVVLGLGEIPLELMRAGHERFHTRMVRFGSFRCQATGVIRPVDPTRRTVLVTPEGIPSEVQILFRVASVCAKRLPSYTFILRCHPQMSMAQALALVAEEIARQPNIILSEHRRIEEDLARASVMLYRGSSSVMYGILQGLRPVYLCHGASDRDPVETLQVWRRRCTTPEELADLLRDDEHAAPEHRQGEWEAAVRYIHAYTGPVEEEGIRAFLAAVGLNGRRD